jgi:lysine/ornithine N-monooxygenase
MADVIGIVGAGPRALSIAIYAQHMGKKVYLIDPEPLSTWKLPNILPKVVMRSPKSFDLVSFMPEEFDSWRLDTYQGLPYKYESQQEIEACPCLVNREEFIEYLYHSFNRLISRGITHIPKSAIGIGKDWIRLSDKSILHVDAVVVAIGSSSSPKVPNWISKTDHYQKLISKKELIELEELSKTYMVVGSGQAAGEYVSHLATTSKVYWITNKDYRVDQYPAPTYKEWGPKSALGSYYRSFYGDSSLEESYLKSIKAWQPSITPHLRAELEDKKDRIVELRLESVRDVDQVIDQVDHILIATGFKTSLSSNPLFNDIQRLPNDPNYPLLSSFRSTSGIYFTGQLAIRFDGPRQASMISAALTAKEILEDMN